MICKIKQKIHFYKIASLHCVLQKAESAAQRAHAFAIASQQNNFSRDTYEKEFCRYIFN